MKQIYEIPEVTIFEVGVSKHMLATSDPQSFGVGFNSSSAGVDAGNADANSNSLDDQSTPWYRQ